MPDKVPPPPPAERPKKGAPIADVREQFKRTTPQTPEDEARTRAFIEGKIEMLRGDPNLSEADKAAAIAELKKKR
jgi:hypothetical protein